MRRPRQVVQVHPGAVPVTQLALDLGVPAGTLTEFLEELMVNTDRDPWTIDERVHVWAADRLRVVFGEGGAA